MLWPIVLWVFFVKKITHEFIQNVLWKKFISIFENRYIAADSKMYSKFFFKIWNEKHFSEEIIFR